MKIVTLDFETFFDSDYSLSKLTTEAYCRDPHCEVLGCGCRWSNGQAEWIPGGPVLTQFLSAINWTTTACLCHHAQFDGFILSHHYGIVPAFYLDTLSMARMVVGNHLSVGLDALAQHYQLAGKQLDYKTFKGKRWCELTAGEQAHLRSGCLHDVALTWDLFVRLMQGFPLEELRVIDQTIRLFTEPTLIGDIDLLAKVWMHEERSKRSTLAALGVDAASLQSSEAFAGLLRQAGIDPVLKPSPSHPGADRIYAFAKTDQFMKELCEDDGRAGALARARLGVRSTLAQTRAERLGFMATRGALPVYLRYCGAHTTRWSGGDQINWQNLPRGSGLRRAIAAPPDHRLIVLDLSQIECRILNVLAGQHDVVESFRRGEDVYSRVASAYYGRAITKATDPNERGFGKVLELACGFGLGPEKLQSICRAGPMGAPPIVLSDAEAGNGIGAYRSTHLYVVAYWRHAGWIIERLYNRHGLDWGPLSLYAGDSRIVLPNGAWLDYETLEWDGEWKAWKLKTRVGWTKLYGGKLVENVVQALARVVLSQAWLRIADAGWRVVMSTHDELVMSVPEAAAERAFEECKRAMETVPAWLPELPVAVEGGISQRYDK